MHRDQLLTDGPARLRTAALTGLLLLLAGCSSGSTATPAASSTAAGAPTSVVTSTSDAVVTETDVVTNTTEVTRTSEDTRTKQSKPAGGGGTTSGGGGGGTSTSSGSGSCPDPETLGAVTPNYDPQYPVNAINCGGEWAVGTYEADGKNQTTGIWRDTGAGWSYQNRADICATADTLPEELYAQACKGN